MIHWLTGLVGKPYILGADGPDAFDCWGLVRYVQERHFGRKLPVINLGKIKEQTAITLFKDSVEYRLWRKLQEDEIPIEGDCILLSPKNAIIHCGVVIEGKRVLHCIENIGVVLETFSQLRLTWETKRLYRWRQ